MHELLENLEKIISKLTEQYHALHAILIRENDIIRRSSIDELHENNKKKEVTLLQIRLLEESNTNILDRIYKQLPRTDETPSVVHLAGLMRDPHGSRIRSAYESLLFVAKTVKEINENNEQLIHGSLRAVKSSISYLIACASTGNPMYEKGGALKTERIARPILSEEA